MTRSSVWERTRLRAMIQLLVIAMVAMVTTVGIGATVTTAAAQGQRASAQWQCEQFTNSAQANLRCGVAAATYRLANIPNADLDDLGELRQRVTYLKDALYWARYDTSLAKFIRTTLSSNGQIRATSNLMAEQRAHMFRLQSELAQARAAVQMARSPLLR